MGISIEFLILIRVFGKLYEIASESFVFDKFFFDQVVPGGGFEPPTRGFSVHCSTPELLFFEIVVWALLLISIKLIADGIRIPLGL